MRFSCGPSTGCFGPVGILNVESDVGGVAVGFGNLWAVSWLDDGDGYLVIVRLGEGE